MWCLWTVEGSEDEGRGGGDDGRTRREWKEEGHQGGVCVFEAAMGRTRPAQEVINVFDSNSNSNRPVRISNGQRKRKIRQHKNSGARGLIIDTRVRGWV